MRLIIDRFEGKYAICENENKEMVNVPVEKLPAEAKEGDLLIEHNDRYAVDVSGTKKLRDDIEKLLDDVFE